MQEGKMQIGHSRCEELKEAPRQLSSAFAVTGLAFQYPKWLSVAISFYLYWTPAENIDPALVSPF